MKIGGKEIKMPDFHLDVGQDAFKPLDDPQAAGDRLIHQTKQVLKGTQFRGNAFVSAQDKANIQFQTELQYLQGLSPQQLVEEANRPGRRISAWLDKISEKFHPNG